jgi:hypothetical protein
MMNNFSQSLNSIQQLISQHQRVAVLLGDTSFDAVAAGVSLGLSLEKSGKKVKSFAASELAGELREIVGADKVAIGLNQQDMVISLQYPLDDIDRVSSNQEGGRLNLVIKVKEGAEPIKKSQVEIYPQETVPEMGFIIGDESRFSNIDKWLGKSSNWIWITNKKGEKKPWATDVVYDQGASFSELSARVIQGLGLPMDRDIGRNLYFGIKRATNSFEAIRSYKTLETAALCFKMFEGVELNKGAAVFEVPSIEEVEKKEGGIFGSSGLPTPKIFRGSTTPKV